MLRIVFAKTYIRLDFYEGDMSAPVASSMFNSVPLPYFLLPIVPPSILWYTSCTGCCSSQVHNEKRKPIMTPMDWSATAAWIALAISIVGTIASPIINSILNNRYQLKLHNLDLKNKYQEQRAETINSSVMLLDILRTQIEKMLTYSVLHFKVFINMFLTKCGLNLTPFSIH